MNMLDRKLLRDLARIWSQALTIALVVASGAGGFHTSLSAVDALELLTADALLARPGSAARIDRWGGPVLKGRVKLVEPAAFTKISALGVEEQRVRVLIDILDAPEKTEALGVAYRVNVRILTSSQDKVLKVPLSALFPLPDADAAPDGAMAVYAIEDGRARLRRVRLGGRNDREAWVLEGLAAGAQLVAYPAAEVRDGVRIKVRDVARQR